MTPKRKLQQFLMASYLYYIRYQSVISDTAYDKLAQDLRESWQDFEHQHKHLVTMEDLNAGTLYRLREEDYPLIVRQAAEMWLEKTQEGKYAGD